MFNSISNLYCNLVFGIILSLGSLPALANDNVTGGASNLMSNEERLIQQKAHQRAYPGGIDEEPLRVQAQLPSASRKMQPATEPIEVDEPAENHKNDSND